MTEFSLNTEFESLINATLTDQEQQKQMEEMTTVLEKPMTNQQKAQISFKIMTLLRGNFFLSLIQPKGSNRKIFYQIFHRLVSIKRIFIIETLYLTFTRF